MVRGTDFSVSASGKQTVVAVNDGKILVKKNSSSCKEVEKIIDKGSAAVVAEKIEIRPLSADEKKEFQKIEELSPQVIGSESEKKDKQ
jgi:ferric-dicitrate binding protein FerR (iron transport regulator)